MDYLERTHNITSTIEQFKSMVQIFGFPDSFSTSRFLQLLQTLGTPPQIFGDIGMSPNIGQPGLFTDTPPTPLYSGTALVSGSPSPSTWGQGGPISPCWQHPLLGWVRDRGASGSGSHACPLEDSGVRKLGLPRGSYPSPHLLPPGSQGLEADKGRGCGGVDQPPQSPRACVLLRMLMGCTLCLVVQ